MLFIHHWFYWREIKKIKGDSESRKWTALQKMEDFFYLHWKKGTWCAANLFVAKYSQLKLQKHHQPCIQKLQSLHQGVCLSAILWTGTKFSVQTTWILTLEKYQKKRFTNGRNKQTRKLIASKPKWYLLSCSVFSIIYNVWERKIKQMKLENSLTPQLYLTNTDAKLLLNNFSLSCTLSPANMIKAVHCRNHCPWNGYICLCHRQPHFWFMNYSITRSGLTRIALRKFFPGFIVYRWHEHFRHSNMARRIVSFFGVIH